VNNKRRKGRPVLDITGNRCGELTVISRAGSDKHGQMTWLCKCDCGNERSFPGHSLRHGRTSNCGEHNRIIVGQRFGRLTVMKLMDHPANNGASLWRCVCDCGKDTIVMAANLRSGITKSCGCLKIERIIESNTTHGHAGGNGKNKTRTYAAWSYAIKRCTSSSCERFKNYGGRGISVCDRWRHSFENFLADMGECPIGFSIERIDVDGNYEPSNCTWIPMKDQAKNTTRTKGRFNGDA